MQLLHSVFMLMLCTVSSRVFILLEIVQIDEFKNKHFEVNWNQPPWEATYNDQNFNREKIVMVTKGSRKAIFLVKYTLLLNYYKTTDDIF